MNGIKQRVLLAVSWSAFALLLNIEQAGAAQMMEVYCTDTDGEDLRIWVFHEGENGDHGGGNLVPVVIELMMDNPDTLWGDPVFPVVS